MSAPSPANVANKSRGLVATTSAPVEQSDALRDAIESLNVSDDVNGTNKRALFGIVRERFAHVAEPLSRDVRGVRVLVDGNKRDAQSSLWLAATGSRKSVAAAERTPGQVTFAQYVSRMTTIATDPQYGLAALQSDDTAHETYAAILAERKGEKEAAALRAAQTAAVAYRAWHDALPSDKRAHIAATVRLFSTDSVARTHAPAFLAMLTIEASA